MSSAIPISVNVAIPPPQCTLPFISCFNAKVMTDSFGGVFKGYGFAQCLLFSIPQLFSIRTAPSHKRHCRGMLAGVLFGPDIDQIRALTEIQGLYCKSRPSMWCSVLRNVSGLTFRYPPSVRLSHPMAKNEAVSAGGETSFTVPFTVHKASTPRRSNALVASRAQSLILRSQRTTTARSCTPASSTASRSCLITWPSLVSIVCKALIRITPAPYLPLDCLPTVGPPKPPHSHRV